MRRRVIAIALIALLLVCGCGMPGDPMLDDAYTQNIYPGLDDTYDIGSATYRYHNIYGVDGVFGYMCVNNNLNVAGDATVTNDVAVGGDVDVGGNVDIGGDVDITGRADVTGIFQATTIIGGNIVSLGKVEADRLIGDIEGYSIEIAQASDLNIALNDTISLSFNFEPDIIVLSYSGRCQHDTTFEAGHTTGHCEIAVTGVDTINYNLNASGLRDSNGAISTVALQNSAINIVGVFGGFDGADWAMFYGVGTWTTATHTLLITFSTADNCNDAQNFIEIMATAYR